MLCQDAYTCWWSSEWWNLLFMICLQVYLEPLFTEVLLNFPTNFLTWGYTISLEPDFGRPEILYCDQNSFIEEFKGSTTIGHPCQFCIYNCTAIATDTSGRGCRGRGIHEAIPRMGISLNAWCGHTVWAMGPSEGSPCFPVIKESLLLQIICIR